MKNGSLTPDAVMKAIAEFDRLGRKQFLAKYGFKGARDYFLRVGGKNYDSKAIAAVAYKYVPRSGGQALPYTKLSGGVAHHEGAASQLRSLGFEVITSGENADWTLDEHILAFDLYMRRRDKLPSKSSAEVLELSSLLNHMGAITGASRTPNYRNAAGVYMKLMNFRRFDPLVQAQGHSGLSRGNKLEALVWKTYGQAPVLLMAAANEIRAAIGAGSEGPAAASEDYEAEEGGVVLRVHRSRERDRRLVEKKKKEAVAAGRRLECEVCEFDFGRRYGEVGEGFIEVHHTKPVSKLKPGEKTRLADLAVVCANCHRMLHRKSLALGVLDLKALLRA